MKYAGSSPESLVGYCKGTRTLFQVLERGNSPYLRSFFRKGRAFYSIRGFCGNWNGFYIPVRSIRTTIPNTAGASAGLAAAFNAPLAGVIFAVEELLKSFTPHMLTSVLLASIGGELGSKYVFGLKPVFGFIVHKYLPIPLYPLLIGLGVL